MKTAKAVAATTLGLAMALGTPTAHAVTDDERFLQVVDNLEIQFGSPAEAIQAGRGVCEQISADQAAGLDPADIRGGIVTSFTSNGLDPAQAANLMWAAADVYCPQYNDVVGD